MLLSQIADSFFKELFAEIVKINLKGEEAKFANFAPRRQRALIDWIKRFDDQSAQDSMSDDMKVIILSTAATLVTPIWPLDWQVPLQLARAGKVYSLTKRKKPRLEITFA